MKGHDYFVYWCQIIVSEMVFSWKPSLSVVKIFESKCSYPPERCTDENQIISFYVFSPQKWLFVYLYVAYVCACLYMYVCVYVVR